MTVALLLRSLDDELEALLAGESCECPVCGEQVEVEVERERVECIACGLVLEAPPAVIDGQLALL